MSALFCKLPQLPHADPDALRSCLQASISTSSHTHSGVRLSLMYSFFFSFYTNTYCMLSIFLQCLLPSSLSLLPSRYSPLHLRSSMTMFSVLVRQTDRHDPFFISLGTTDDSPHALSILLRMPSFAWQAFLQWRPFFLQTQISVCFLIHSSIVGHQSWRQNFAIVNSVRSQTVMCASLQCMELWVLPVYAREWSSRITG